jgi:hypothetical protein
MRSRRGYIITKDEVHGYANLWLDKSLKLEYEGTKCTASTLLQILLIAAARTVSLFAACRDLADAPTDQTIRNALEASLPDISELERRLNRSLSTKLPKALFRKSRRIAIDLTLIPYHGQPYQDEKEIYRSLPKSGTTHFHAYATAAVVQFFLLWVDGHFDSSLANAQGVAMTETQESSLRIAATSPVNRFDY